MFDLWVTLIEFVDRMRLLEEKKMASLQDLFHKKV